MTNTDSNEQARRFAAIAGWIYAVSGVGLALLSMSPGALQSLTRLAIPEALAPDRALGLYAGVCGGLTAGFGAAMVGVARAKSVEAAARAVAIGLVTWFVVDTSASLGHGSSQNAIGNACFLAVGLPPMWMLGRGSRTTRSASEPQPT